MSSNFHNIRIGIGSNRFYLTKLSIIVKQINFLFTHNKIVKSGMPINTVRFVSQLCREISCKISCNYLTKFFIRAVFHINSPISVFSLKSLYFLFFFLISLTSTDRLIGKEYKYLLSLFYHLFNFFYRSRFIMLCRTSDFISKDSYYNI